VGKFTNGNVGIAHLELLDARQDGLIAKKNNIDSTITALIAKASR